MLSAVDFHMGRQRFGNSAFQQGFNTSIKVSATPNYATTIQDVPLYLDPWSYGDTQSAADELSLGIGSDDMCVVLSNY